MCVLGCLFVSFLSFCHLVLGLFGSCFDGFTLSLIVCCYSSSLLLFVTIPVVLAVVSHVSLSFANSLMHRCLSLISAVCGGWCGMLCAA